MAWIMSKLKSRNGYQCVILFLQGTLVVHGSFDSCGCWSQWCPIGVCESELYPAWMFQSSQNPVSALGAPTVTSDGLTSPVLARFQRKSWVTLCSWSQFHVLQLDYSVWIINYFKKVSENLSRNCLKNYQEHIWKVICRKLENRNYNL